MRRCTSPPSVASLRFPPGGRAPWGGPAALALVLVAAAMLAGCDRATSLASRAGVTTFETRCEKTLPPTKIEVVTAPLDYAIDREHSYAALTKMSGESRPALHALGLTTAQVGHRASLESTGVEETTTRRICVRPAIRVELAMTPMTVYVSREAAADSCRDAAILEHELKHVAVYEQRLAEIEREVEPALVEAFGNRVFYFASRAEGERELQRVLKRELDATLGDSARKLRERQEEVDSPEEYANVAAACGGIGVLPDTATRVGIDK
jgi:hypothetical protein